MQWRFMAMIDRFWSGLSATNAAMETPTSPLWATTPARSTPVVAIERRLDFPELDAVAAFLDHPVAAPVELEATAADVPDEIAGAVPAMCRRRRPGKPRRSVRAGRNNHASRRGPRSRARQVFPAATSRPCSSTTRAQAAGRPGRSGNASVRSAGMVAGIGIGRANVGLGRPVQVPHRGRGPESPQPRERGHRERPRRRRGPAGAACNPGGRARRAGPGAPGSTGPSTRR